MFFNSYKTITYHLITHKIVPKDNNTIQKTPKLNDTNPLIATKLKQATKDMEPKKRPANQRLLRSSIALLASSSSRNFT
jgi:hypothetical protein